MSKALEDHYQQNCDAYRGDQERAEQKANLLSRLRLGVFLLVIPVVIFWNHLPWPGLFLLAIAAAFLWLVRVHEDAKEARRVARWLFRLNEEELLYLREHRFPTYTVNLPVTEHAFANDLDLFGEYSLFHLINRTVTVYGRETLASTLIADPLSKEEILRQQEAIRELSGMEKFRQHFLAMGRDEGLQQNDLNKTVEWLKNEEDETNLDWYRWARFAWPVISIGVAAVSWWYDHWAWFTPVAAIAWSIVGNYRKRTNAVHESVSGQQQALHRFAGLFAELSSANFVSPGLKALQEEAQEAQKALKQLAQISERFGQRKNMLASLVLNTFGLYDLRCLLDIHDWKKANGEKVEDWIKTIGRTETLISAATFHYNHPSYCFAEIMEGAPQLEAKELAHPILSPKQRIPNEVSFLAPKKLLFITGSNMSGKSTFLRTLGMNLVLAQAGFPVCAKTFRFTPMKICTSIRISDSLQENTSLFYAELLKLRSVLDELEKGTRCLVLLDEILRGTNSADKYQGAYEFIKKMIPHNGLIVFATHDLKLCEMHNELPEITENYRFEGIIEGDKLHFPYKIEKGIVKNRTATFLMKQLRLVE